MLSESFKIVYFAGVLASLLSISTAKCPSSDPACNYKVEGGHLSQPPNYELEEIPNSSTSWGQSPYWDHQTNNLYYVDMNAAEILRYNYEEEKVYKAKVKGEKLAGFIIPVEDKPNQFVVGCGLRVLIVEWDGYSDKAIPLYTLFTVKSNGRTLIDRFIYGKCDARGRLLAGTFKKTFVFDIKKLNLSMKYELSSVNFVWDDRRKKIYYIDIHDLNIKEYPYDLETGITDFGNQKVVMDFRRTNSSEHIKPFDMTIDNVGNLYVAANNDDRIHVINPEVGQNKVLYTIKLPCARVSSVVFGGPNLDILYVTTGTSTGNPPPCGSVFEITGLDSEGPISYKAVIPIKPNYKIKNIPNSRGLVGRSLDWDHQTNNLYYVDMNAGQILRYNYGKKKVYKAKVKGEMFPGFIIPVEGKPNQFVVGCRLRVLIVEWDGFSDIATPIDTLFEVGGLQNRTNSDPFIYGKCDGRGRLFAGTFPRTFVFDIKKRNLPMKYELSSVNFVWDNRKKKIYYIDTHDLYIKEYPYDLETGITDFSHQKIVMNFYKTNSSKKYIIPYDMTIDRDGNLYVATANDGRIYVINPEKDKLLYTIKLPCAHVTSVVFGGRNLDILYVTTAKGNGKPTTCGSVFEITGLGSYGITLNKAVITTKPNYELEKIPNSIASAGKSLYWDHQTNNLYYVDKNAGEILRYDYGEEKVYKAKVKGQMFPGFIIPVKYKSNLFVVGCAPRVLIVEWDGYSDIATPVDTLLNLRLKYRIMYDTFNYGKCDHRGRLFAGTIYNSLLFDIKKSHLPTNYERYSMNVVWDDERQKVYYIDMDDFNIKGYPYDFKTGITDFSRQKVVMDFRTTNSSEEHIYAHDMTIDRAGNLYVAPFNDDRIYVINPDMNKVLYTIKLPCSEVTSVVFGGPNLDILYITTGTSTGDPPPCGSVFKITGLGSYGITLNKAVITTKPNYKIKKIVNSSTSGGQSLYWDDQHQNLYYVDIISGEILRYHYGEEKVYKAKVEGENNPGFIIPVEGKPNQFVVGWGFRVRIVEWDGYSDIATPIRTLFKLRLRHRSIDEIFYYGKCDQRGRLFAGNIYNSLEFDIKKSKLPTNSERLSMNVVWDDERQKVYYIDAHDSNIKGYPYDLETGITDFSHKKFFMNLYKTNSSEEHVNAVDMTIDRDGNLYVAPFNDDRIYVINPDMNKVLYTIKLPCSEVTSVVFGGPNLDILYVTTGKDIGSPPSCGSVFEITGLGSYGFILSKAVTKRTRRLIR